MIDDRILALYELSQDMLFHKIPAGRLNYYIDGSLAAGEAAARQFSGCDIFDLYRQYGIVVDYRTNRSSSFGVTLRGQAVMGEKECRVELYTDSIRALVEHSNYDGLPELNYDRALRIHLSHEFFHFWEYKTGTSVTEQLDSVETIRLFGLSRKAKINRCGEVAAHAFAKRLLGLPCLPNLYDYIYLIGTGRMARGAFESRIETLTEILAPVKAI
ncbi:hypothetical protein [Marasmitruncus massiliensis]|uniref:hypothetical protein n=1 Tax=Marasmitruncus massiliensis TaxID=1944642 RepID=UPI000C7C4D66|nr:hypothetical protein [Marasmitruncus massiliensis]